MNDNKYSYGQLTAQHPDDAEFETKVEAIEAAYARSLGKSFETYGVWQNGTGELLAIVYNGRIFKAV